MIHTDPAKRHDFVFLFDVTYGNPNGDPDAGNLPRTDPETGHGLVTDVAIKRRVRDYVHTLHGQPIFIQSQVPLNTVIRDDGFKAARIELTRLPLRDKALRDWFQDHQPEGFALEEDTLIYTGESGQERAIRDALLAALDDDSPDNLRQALVRLAREVANQTRQEISEADREKARRHLCAKYYDIRLFGAVLQTGLNAGQVRGPIQFTFAQSVDPIRPLDVTITRQARTTTARQETGSTEMGRKALVPYALYRAHGFFSPALADGTGVSSQDLELFWEALTHMFEFDRSASRGELACRGLYVFTHDHPRGNAPAHQLFRRVEVQRNPAADADSVPRQYEDYQVTVRGDCGPRDQVPRACPLGNGVTLTVLAEG